MSFEARKLPFVCVLFCFFGSLSSVLSLSAAAAAAFAAASTWPNVDGNSDAQWATKAISTELRWGRLKISHKN